MGEKEDKEKAEKLAAAKKRVAQMQKKKKAAGGASEKQSSTSKAKSTETTKAKDKDHKEEEAEPLSPTKESAAEEVEPEGSKDAEATQQEEKPVAEEQPDTEENADEEAFNAAIRSAKASEEKDEVEEERNADSPSPDNESGSTSAVKSRKHIGRQPSVSLQSKIRSASFRQGSAAGPSPMSPPPGTVMSPDGGDDVPDIYRKQLARIEELEKENKRLAKEAQENEGRWRKNEVELEELREKAAEPTNGAKDSDEVEQLRSQIESLRRSQRQSISFASGKGRTGSIPNEDGDHLRQEIESKDSTISDLQLEISRLRSQVSAQTQGCETHGEQISALTSSLGKQEGTVKRLETELADTKKALTRASEKAVLDGTERTSKDTRIKSMERDLEDARSTREESEKKASALEKKIEAMNKLHREAEQRNATKLASVEGAAREAQMLKAKLESLEKDNVRLREAKKRTMSGGGGDDGLDELEDEDRQKLEKRIRELEGENFDLRRGLWRDKRREMQPNLTVDGAAATAGGDDFDEVDLNGGSAGASRRASSFQAAPMQTRHSGFTQVLNSGLAAFRGSTTSPDSQMQKQNRPRNDSLLEEFDDDDAPFDENAFAAAQKEEEMKKMVEHVREIKKGLKQWVGWRLDLVDVRRSGGGGMGFGEVFEV